jgi:hypothetical protein
MLASFRKTLVESQVGAVAVALLVVWSCGWILGAFYKFIPGVIYFVVNFVAVVFTTHEFPDTTMSIGSLFPYVFAAMKLGEGILLLVATWLFSRWLFGAGPVRALSGRLIEIVRPTHV